MFQSFYYPDGWNSNTKSFKELDEKDLRGVQDIDNALLNNKFLKSNNVAVALCNRKNETGDIKFFNQKDFHIQFGALKYTKLFDKLYIPYIDKFIPKKEEVKRNNHTEHSRVYRIPSYSKKKRKKNLYLCVRLLFQVHTRGGFLIKKKE